MRLVITILLLAGLTVATSAEPIAVTTAPVARFQSVDASADLGPLQWRGGLVLDSPDESFGGLSGLILSSDCTSLLAVSDTGTWLRAVVYYEEGRIAGLTRTEWAPMRDAKGQPFAGKFDGDAEALASLGDGRYLVGFERFVRVGLYDIGRQGLNARFKLLPSPKAIGEGPPNGEIEALSHLTEGPWKGHDLAISEAQFDANGNTRGWLWQGWKTVPFSVARLEDYKVTDAAMAPGGDILILQRSFGLSLLPGMAIARIRAADIKDSATVTPDLLFEGRAPAYAIDNMEGMALCRKDGELRLTIVSDNNLSSLQRTLLLQFALTD
ncbi:MAG: esterase-like activity of phytase family protein [Rhizobiales bacterium]|nr:esterase-like activity of phytase family protein [Hyphomicrobiales bacterium]